MVDSVKQYNLAGVAKELQLGKRGAKIDGTDSEQVSLKSANGSKLVTAEIADGTADNHAVTQAQLLDAASAKMSDVIITVNHDDGNANLGTFSADSVITSIMIEKGAGNWIGADSDTEITVGIDGNNTLLYSGFDPEYQSRQDINYVCESDLAVKAYITAGGATAGTAKIRMVYAGVFTAAE